MNFQECDLGFTYQSESILVFFGKKNADSDKIKTKYPSINFLRVQQIHSDNVVEASHQLIEADSHWTTKTNTGLLIATADCLPIMIYNKKTNVIAAVHAGWRGVENQITLKTLKEIITPATDPNDIRVWIGPHILRKSFEVDRVVLDLLLKSNLNKDKSNCFFSLNEKFFVDLADIVKSQIFKIVGNFPDVFMLAKDTKTDFSFYSFRRDKENSGRNLSFIVRLN